MVFDQNKIMPVLIGIYLVAMPMFSRLPPYVLFLIFSFTAWVILIIIGRVKPPISFVRLMLAASVLISLIASYGTIFGQEPGTAMLLMLSFLKLFEMKGKRDVLLVIFLGYFLIATNFFHTQSPWIAVYVFIVVVYLTSLLLVFSDRLSSTDFKTRIKISTKMLLQAIPLMLVLFVLFPRIPGPLWSLPEDVKSAGTGVDDKMSPGSINKLISSGAVAFRVQFKQQPPEKKDLYWRGLVLSDYDGKTWTRDDAPARAKPEVTYVSAEAKISEYTVMLEPHARKWLFSLESLIGIEGDYRVTRELQVLSKEPVSSVLSYQMSSNLNVTNKSLYEPERVKNLLLPQGLNPRTIALAKKLWLQAGGNSAEFVSLVLTYFNTQPFFYTLSPLLLGDNAMDDFIFNSQRGFCEHYSSSFVYLMRAAGVPARVIVGYQGGEMSPVDDYMIVRQSDAHAWAEVWSSEQGWTRVDPTAAVSPDRIERGVANAGLDQSKLPSILVLKNEYLIQLGYTLDSFNHGWNKWVVGFNEKKQQELFELLGIENIDKSTLFSWMVIAMTLSGGLLALWIFRSGNKRNKRDVAAYYYDVFCHKLEKAGLLKRRSESADEFLLRIVQQLPELKPDADFITLHYQQIRYGGDDSLEHQKQFIQAVKHFRVNTAVKK